MTRFQNTSALLAAFAERDTTLIQEVRIITEMARYDFESLDGKGPRWEDAVEVWTSLTSEGDDDEGCEIMYLAAIDSLGSDVARELYELEWVRIATEKCRSDRALVARIRARCASAFESPLDAPFFSLSYLPGEDADTALLRIFRAEYDATVATGRRTSEMEIIDTLIHG